MQSNLASREPVIDRHNIVPLALGLTGILCLTGLSAYAIRRTGSTEALTALAPITTAFHGVLAS